jgi:hypothetical protein
MYMWDCRQERVVVQITVGTIHLHTALTGIIELLKVWISHSFMMSLVGCIGVHFGRPPLKMKAAGFPKCWYLSFGMWWPCGTAGRCQYFVGTYCLRFQGVLPYFHTNTWPRTTEDNTIRPHFQPVCFTSFPFTAPYQFTPLLNLPPLTSGLTLCGWFVPCMYFFLGGGGAYNFRFMPFWFMPTFSWMQLRHITRPRHNLTSKICWLVQC